jgi:hypothetical protein
MDKHGNQFHWFDNNCIPQQEVEEEEPPEAAAKYDLLRGAASTQRPVNRHDGSDGWIRKEGNRLLLSAFCFFSLNDEGDLSLVSWTGSVWTGARRPGLGKRRLVNKCCVSISPTPTINNLGRNPNQQEREMLKKESTACIQLCPARNVRWYISPS